MLIHRRHNLSHEEIISHKDRQPMKTDLLFDIERLNRQIAYLNQGCYTSDYKAATINEIVDESERFLYSKLVFEFSLTSYNSKFSFQKTQKNYSRNHRE